MLAALAAVVFFLGTAQALPSLSIRADSCPADTPRSCSASSPPSGVSKCCYEAPGGVLVLTQFWDYNPSNGPVDEFTIHGLWPDNCDGTYEASCDASLNIKGSVKDIVVGQFNDQSLYTYMSGHWKGLHGDEDLWTHEYNKHGTCINTIHPDCYSGYKQNQNIYDFFTITTSLHKKLSTYKYLAAAGITPSSSKTYTKAEIQKALDAGFGHKVYFACDKSGALNELWYFHHLQGSLLGQNFVSIDSLNNSGCSATGIKYPPKSGGGSEPEPTPSNGPTTSHSPSTTGGTGPTNVPSSGYIKAGSKSGCLISAGKYYESGTCATFKFDNSNIKSSKGYCTVDSASAFTCSSGTAATQFTFGAGNAIAFDGVSDWCLGTATGNPPQTNVVLARGGACNGKQTFKLTA